MSFLEVKNLRKRFGDIEVLKGIDYSLKKGEVLSIIGSSGGGKTTLLRCLNFLETANEGEIIIGDKTVFCANGTEKPTVSQNRTPTSLAPALYGRSIFPTPTPRPIPSAQTSASASFF